MIFLTRLNGSEIYINPELILSLESSPDTVITMTNGEKYVLKEPVQKVVEQFMAYKKQIHSLQQPTLQT